ncbi:MAG: FkbM family methyltransferase [Bacteroidaceae bacterium]|nr:FkbM family methyltransferase [Bacteroidaceae bacterium]
MKSYAQDQEDIILNDILKGVENGFYIDIGANDPDVYSVTKLFYEKGWSGINVEPLLEPFHNLCQKRERDINLNIGIGNKHGIMHLHLDGLGSTFSDEVVIDNHLEKKGTIPTEVWTLGELLNTYDPKIVHFRKIDVEGYEKQVLEGMDWSYRPWVFCMESTKPGTFTPCYQEWEHILKRNDYVLKEAHGINRYYVDSWRKWE